MRRRRRCCASFYSKFGSLQVETILTVALVMLTLCGMVRDSTSHAPCSMPGPAPLRRLCAAYNTQVRTICSALACMVGAANMHTTIYTTPMQMRLLCTSAQAFSWGGYLPGLADGAPAYVVVVIAAWVVISVGCCLTLMALAGEASFSVACSREPRRWPFLAADMCRPLKISTPCI